MTDEPDRVVDERLRQFVQRYERLEVDKKDIIKSQKLVMVEAKRCGYNTKALKNLITIRKRLNENGAILELYKQALGM